MNSKIDNLIQDTCAYWMELGMEINNVDNTSISEKAEKAKVDLKKAIYDLTEAIIGQDEEEVPTYRDDWDAVDANNKLRAEQRLKRDELLK